MRFFLSILLCGAMSLCTTTADAEAESVEERPSPPPRQRPEITANLAVGGGAIFPLGQEEGESNDGATGSVRFGFNTSATFLRASNREFGLGLYAEVMTSSFRDIMPSAGLSLLMPIHRDAPLVLWLGAHYDFDGEHAGGVSGRLWWGAHNHNHFRVYNTTFGIWVELKANLWGNNDLIVAGGVDLDLSVLFTPWLWFASWVRGPGSS